MTGESTSTTGTEITRRLRTVSELRNLCLSLGRAKRMTTAAEASVRRAKTPTTGAGGNPAADDDPSA